MLTPPPRHGCALLLDDLSGRLRRRGRLVDEGARLATDHTGSLVEADHYERELRMGERGEEVGVRMAGVGGWW